MKKNNAYMLNQVAGNNILVPIGNLTLNMNFIVSLNEIGVFIWNLLDEDRSIDFLISRVMDEYSGVSAEQAEHDISMFISQLKEKGCIEV